MTISSNHPDGTFTDEDVIEALAEPAPSFDYDRFMAEIGMGPTEEMLDEPDLFEQDWGLDFQADCDIPPRQWMAALMYRTLTPAEQLAREKYFERRVNEALALVRKDHDEEM